MKINTSDLQGSALDWAVAKCECGDEIVEIDDPHFYSTDWAQGGPIIEREWLSLECWPNESDEGTRWVATRYEQPAICKAFGPTPLIAAMRCYVASKLGAEVEIPDELRA